MKSRYLLYLLLCIIFVSCKGEDRREEYADVLYPNHWMEEIMRKDYYWYEDIPDKLNFFVTDPATFFKSLLSTKDGKSGRNYSYLENFREAQTRIISKPEDSYGFDFHLSTVTGQNNLFALVAYVVPNSPASEAGLRRGDWILKVGDADITQDNYSILQKGGATRFAMGAYDDESKSIVALNKDIEIAASRTVEDNPIHYYAVYQTSKGNVGYLVYNHFTAGKSEKDKTYDDELRKLSLEFKNADIKEFILDLRYNLGGLLSTANLLSTILAPESAMGKKLGYMRYNDKRTPLYEDVIMDSGLLAGGTNLNLNRLYVLTSASTASASELLIYCLSPYMEVITIGEKTEGKNVGSVTHVSDEYQLAIHPIVCQFFNSEDASDYDQGITPTHSLGLTSDLAHFLPFGDSGEFMLDKALTLIEGESEQRGLKHNNNNNTFSFVYSSIERKSIPAVIID